MNKFGGAGIPPSIPKSEPRHSHFWRGSETNPSEGAMITEADTDPESTTWDGLQWPVRVRMAAAARMLLTTGRLSRSALARATNISNSQACIDITNIRARLPDDYLRYDTRSKTWVAQKEHAHEA